MTEQSGGVLRDWLRERGANARRLAALKTGQDRAGWLEDAAYFDAAALAVSRATPPTPEQAGPSGEALDDLALAKAVVRSAGYSLVTQKFIIRFSEFIQDWRKGDFDLPKLAALDVESCFDAWQEVGNLDETNAALASPGAMEGAQAAQPAFALQSCWLYAARHRKEEWAKTILGFCGAAGCGSPLRTAPPPTGEPT